MRSADGIATTSGAEWTAESGDGGKIRLRHRGHMGRVAQAPYHVLGNVSPHLGEREQLLVVIPSGSASTTGRRPLPSDICKRQGAAPGLREGLHVPLGHPVVLAGPGYLGQIHLQFVRQPSHRR